MNIGRICVLLSSSLLLSACNTKRESLAADTLYVGRHILAMDDKFADATAVAIHGEKIVWVGKREAWNGDAAKVVELGERALLPGLIDAHGHLSFLARTVNLANVSSPPVGAVVSIDALQEALRGYIRERQIPRGEWVLGMGYDDSLLEEQRHPDRDDLDAVSNEHAIALIHVSGHLAAANTMALGKADITARTTDPAGGVIRRRPDSTEPNGVLEEAAARSIQRFFFSGEDIRPADLAKALHTYASFGITTVQDGAASLSIYEMFTRLAAAGELSLDVVVYPIGMDPTFEIPPEIVVGEYRDRLKFGGVKLILDGSPQGKTAYLSQPYAVVPAGLSDDYRGYPSVEIETVRQRVGHFISEGIPMLAHANGDAAADMLIDAVEAAGGSAKLGDHRTVMIHAQTVREDQLDRMQALGILPSYFSAHTFYWGDWHRDSVLGEKRASRISPTRSTLERGMRFTVHNDAPIVPPDMIRLLWATTNRLTRSGRVLGEDQRISTLESIRAITVNAAFQNFEEDTKGSITPGKQADLVILSQDPLEMDSEDLLSLYVVETVSRGVSVYTAPSR